MKERISPAALSALAKGDLDNFGVAATPGGIEQQEKMGQGSFVASETLPKEMLHGCTREKLEAMGIVFGNDVDDLFVNVRLPEGWKKQAHSHPMWSDLFDAKGRPRAAIFYKAAFYDRKAHISLTQRYSFTSYGFCNAQGEAVCAEEATHYQTVITDCGVPLLVIVVREKGESWDLHNAHEKQARDWLDAHFPDWGNPLAYWD